MSREHLENWYTWPATEEEEDTGTTTGTEQEQQQQKHRKKHNLGKEKHTAGEDNYTEQQPEEKNQDRPAFISSILQPTTRLHCLWQMCLIVARSVNGGSLGQG